MTARQRITASSGRLRQLSIHPSMSIVFSPDVIAAVLRGLYNLYCLKDGDLQELPGWSADESSIASRLTEGEKMRVAGGMSDSLRLGMPA